MKICKAYCLFEQSGTFKNEFKKLGICAEDYDIANDFGETDHQIDLFAEIDKAYNKEPSIFDEITPSDLIMAFFPCTRFEDQAKLWFMGNNYSQREWSDERKLEYSMTIHHELDRLYSLLCKLFIISLRGGYRMIVENPYSSQHHLTHYFPIKAALIDKDRTEDGDYYKKPTQFWFVNCKPESNLVFEPIWDTPQYIVTNTPNIKGLSSETVRSLIHPQYARRFILRYIGHSVVPVDNSTQKER